MERKTSHVVSLGSGWIRASKGQGKSYHVVSSGSGWIVRRSRDTRASGRFRDRSEAISFARSRAKGSCSEMIVHGRDGWIHERNSYGKDSCSPSGKR
jgi:hypothetical protein